MTLSKATAKRCSILAMVMIHDQCGIKGCWSTLARGRYGPRRQASRTYHSLTSARSPPCLTEDPRSVSLFEGDEPSGLAARECADVWGLLRRGSLRNSGH